MVDMLDIIDLQTRMARLTCDLEPLAREINMLGHVPLRLMWEEKRFSRSLTARKARFIRMKHPKAVVLNVDLVFLSNRRAV